MFHIRGNWELGTGEERAANGIQHAHWFLNCTGAGTGTVQHLMGNIDFTPKSDFEGT